MKSTSTNGFTLLELLIVVVMVGILGAIAAPGWLSFLSRQQMNSVRDEMLQVLQSAQSDAQQDNKSYTVSVDSTAGSAALTVGPSGTTGIQYELGSDPSRSKLKLEPTVASVTFTAKGEIDESIGNPPFVISIVTKENNPPRCIVLTTLLGGMVTAEGENCTNPQSYKPVP